MDTMQFINYISNLKYHSYKSACNNMLNHVPVIGRGDYGIAFRLSDGKVCKLYKSYDKAYKTFLKLAAINDSPHLPYIICHDEYNKFSWVLLEFLSYCQTQRYFNLSFTEIVDSMSMVVQGNVVEGVILPSSLVDLSLEMREYAQGFCLDFRPPNFMDRQENLVVIDPFTNKTNHNNHLIYIEKVSRRRKVA